MAGYPTSSVAGGHHPVVRGRVASFSCDGSVSVPCPLSVARRPATVSAVTQRRAPRVASPRASLWLGAVLLLAQAAGVGAQSASELAAGGRQLRDNAAVIEPLPDSPLNHDVGDLAVIAHDGSAYDRLLEGEPNYLARERVGRRFFETHADEYDFLVVFTNFEFDSGGATAFHLYGRNDVEGIGKPIGSVAPVVFGSPARLKGWIDMGAVSRYRQRPLALAPGDPGFLRTLGVLAHEVGHQWLAEARYRVGDTVFDDLLGHDQVHWSYLLDSDASYLYGARWRENGDGSFTATQVGERFSALDLYLMGLRSQDKVPPLRLLRNPDVDRTHVNREGDEVTAAEVSVIPIQQLIDAMGPRRPDSLHSQKEFRLGFVFLTAPGTEPTAEDLEAVERVRRAFGAHFFALTNGVAWADTTLGGTTPVAGASAPDVDRAIAWLAAQQHLDGRWADAAQTEIRDTATVVGALIRAGVAGPPPQRGLGWLQGIQSESLDSQARANAVLSEAGLPAGARAILATRLLQAQNADGGFGAGRDFASDALDTALALRALAALRHPADDRVRRAVATLSGLAGPDGGWPAVTGAETSTVVTAEVLLALLDWKDVVGSAALRGPGLAALLARQNPDGGFGASPSTPHASALALEVLLAAGAGVALVDPLTAWLEREQLADGSWAASPYQTALVVSALRRSLGANLVIPANTLACTPNPVEEGVPVRVVARVRNDGRATASASIARLFDGDPTSSPARAETAVPELAAGEEAEISFEYATSDRAGSRTLYVVADAGQTVRESREDDNTASSTLAVVGLLADLAVLPTDIVLEPAVPEVGEDAVISVTVRNRGDRSSPACSVGVSIVDSMGRGLSPAAAPLAALAPGDHAMVSIPWTPAAEGSYVVRAMADARFEVPELDEANGSAERAARVVAQAPAGAALALLVPRLDPAALRELPQAFTLSVTVENAGRTPAFTSLAVHDPSAASNPIATETVSVGARSAFALSLPIVLAAPGARELELVIDPDDAVPEDDESDNRVLVSLGDERTHDLELETAVLSASEVVVGQPVTVTVQARNRGTLGVLSIPLRLARETDAESAELARADLSLPAGQALSVDLTWTPTIAEEDVPLVVRVDPFDLLDEQREDNNFLPLLLRVTPSELPNLTLTGTDLSFAPDPPMEGQPAVVSAIVRNAGTSAAGSFVVRFFAGDPDQGGRTLGEVAVSSLEGSGARTLSLDLPSLDVRGGLGLVVVVDALEEVAESLESDNRAFRPFSVLGFPDLVLAAADVTLDPGYPRAGEVVTIRAVVRNLGGQPSGATTLVASEALRDEPTPIGTLDVPALLPGASLELALAFTPADPPGARLLSLVLDPESAVVEQDEGNNSVHRTIVAQNADLYLTEPYFSPNGDGVKDETALAWRAGEGVRVEVEDAAGRRLRTLVTDGPAAGSAVWDGRDERGALARDGRYGLSLIGASGTTLGRLTAVLDTNRSLLHDATPADTLVRNLSCALPEDVAGPAWMPGEDAVLFVANADGGGFEPGLIRVGLDGSYEYLHRDPFYARASFGSDAAVSPDGRDVLVRVDFQLFRVDLATGERVPLPADPYTARWSPDGRFIATATNVLTRDGDPVGTLDPSFYYWSWSPSSDRLAAGPVVVARDGTELKRLALRDDSQVEWTSWLADGRVATGIEWCSQDDRSPDPSCRAWYLLDPDDGTSELLPWSADRDPAWAPDGTRVLTEGLLRQADGQPLWPLLPFDARVSPAATAAWFRKWTLDQERPGRVCGGKQHDSFAVASLANLTADLQVSRLAANNGLLIRGTVADANLERFELDYARQGEAPVWHPIGPAYDVPVVDDEITPWVPPSPGSYVLRLRVHDRAGNTRTRTRVVSWDRVPALANFTQTEYFLSPQGAVKSSVSFGFLVIEPTTLVVRIVGPQPEPGGPAPVERRVERFELTSFGPGSYVWDGRDAAARVVPDGRYTVFLNDLPFRVQVDGTPPEIALRFDRLHVVGETFEGQVCNAFPPLDGSVTLGTIAADRSWHAVDPHLKAWTFSDAAGLVETGTDEVYEVERDAAGLPIVDPGGALRIRRVGGQPANRVDDVTAVAWRAQSTDMRFEAEDYAGNRSELVVPPVPEGILPLGAAYRCKPTLVPPVASELEPDPVKGPIVHPLTPGELVLVAGASLNRGFEEQDVRFSFEPREGGASREVAVSERERGVLYLPVESFEALGVDPLQTYRGRFLGKGAAGEVASDPFLFRPCEEWLWAEVVERTPLPPLLILRSQTNEPIVQAWATVRGPEGSIRIDLVPWGDGIFAETVAHGSCTSPHYSVHARTASGRLLPDGPMRSSSCVRERQNWPGSSCSTLGVGQTFPYCDGTPDQLHLTVTGLAPEGSRIDIEVADRGAPPIASFVVTESQFIQRVVADVRGEPEGLLRVRAWLTPPDPKPEDPVVESFADTFVDRTPAVAEVLLPPENGLACLVPAPGAEALTARVVARDVSPELEIESAELRELGAGFSPLRWICPVPGVDCDRPVVKRGVPGDLVWDALGRTGGDHDLRFSFCDRAGNRTSAERRLTLTRAVKPRVVSVAPDPFSPNADGRADTVTAVFRLAEAALVSAAVRQGSPDGPLVRSLLSEQLQLASDVPVTWDGLRDDATAVGDGRYYIVFSAENGCASVAEAVADVRVDLTPPEVGIASPGAGQGVQASVDVRGQVTDEHLASWRLEVACGGAGPILLATNRNRVEAGGRIAAWDTSQSPPGACRLVLSAEDRAQNRAEAETPVQVETGGFIRQLVASPDLFSPNGDGRRETSTVRFELAQPARTRLEIRRTDASVVRVLEASAERGSGSHELVWDGRDAGAVRVADADYVAWLRAEAPGDAAVYEEQTVPVVVDTSPPALAISRPAEGAYVPADTRVQASIADAHLLEYILGVTPGGGPPAELARDSRPVTDAPLVSLAQLSDGPHSLTLAASDLAENQATLSVSFHVDSGPPLVGIQSPTGDKVLPRGEAPIPVTGRVEDANLVGWSLRFGAGSEPAAFATIAEGASGGGAVALGSWNVQSLLDGPYTLSLVASDRAGLQAESRVAVTLDGTPPQVSLASPLDGDYITAPAAVVGSVRDSSLASWLLEAAPGAAAAAYRWEPIATGSSPINDDELATWSPLPPDGFYTLRLTGTDSGGLKASARLGVEIDTTPPATPVGLAARVTRASDTHGLVLLDWTPNTEPDLAGYLVRRDESEPDTEIRASASWDDGERPEGRYGYSVVAVDRAGNRSGPARLSVRVDVTPPAVSFASPAEDASVSGAIEVRGTAYSADDFAEYRLLVGAGDAPSSWTLLRRSTVAVAAARLGDWLAIGDGSYRLALEAEDVNGNRARVTRRVLVDTDPPAPPVLTAVTRDAGTPDLLRAEWQPGASSDLVGHLVYRNGRLANAATLVLGDLTVYAVPGEAYEDAGLPDGRHCYRVVALDRAGNSSLPSNEICESLDNRAPAAAIAQPADHSRFGQPIRVVAVTPDLDVAEIRFELQAFGDAEWRALGTLSAVAGQPIPPWELTLDPAAPVLEPGDYRLRAVATDHAGLSDPDPASITITYGDTTPPPPPLELAASVDGADVSLRWAASDAPDFDSYHVYRDGQRLTDGTEGLDEAEFLDAGRAPGNYEYRVTAIDEDGNESAPSASAPALVYALVLDEPEWPLVTQPEAAVTGDGARAETTLHVLRDATSVASAPGVTGRFEVAGVPLATDGNLLTARGEDALGNRSIVSNEIVLISNDPPAAVNDLTASVAGRDVTLRFASVADADLAGYVVRRDGRAISRTLPQTEAAAIEASGGEGPAVAAFDENPDTTWPAFAPATGEWTIRFPVAVLVTHVRIRFAATSIASSYGVFAEWQGRFLRIARGRANAQPVVEHRLPSALATTALRVVLDAPGRLAEVSIDRLDAVPPDATEANDRDVPDGRHRYTLAAIDRYGAEGPAAEVEAGVGDLAPPAPPLGLVATPDGRDVELAWDASPEPDLAHYLVLRDGARIGRSETVGYRDRGLANGTYTYVVIAVDRAGLESGESAPASATVALGLLPPARPVILEPTDAAHPIVLDASRTDVAGRSEPGTTVEIEVNGVARGTTAVQPGFARSGTVAGPAWYPWVLSPDGGSVAWIDGASLVVRGLDSVERSYATGGAAGGGLYFSPQGDRLAFERYVSATGWELALLDLTDTSVRRVADGLPSKVAWSPDGRQLALARQLTWDTGAIETVDVDSGTVTEVERGSGTSRWLRWSPEGSRLAVLRSWSEGACELRVLALDSGERRVLDAQPWPQAPPAWSPDGTLLAWTSAAEEALRVRLHDVVRDEPAGQLTEPQADAVDARFSPTGGWLSYVRVDRLATGSSSRSVVARQLDAGLTVTVAGPRESDSWPLEHEWRGTRLGLHDGAQVELFAAQPGRFQLPHVPLEPGDNLVVARAADPATGRTSPDSEAILVSVAEQSFPDLAVEPAALLLAPSVPQVGQDALLRVRVTNLGGAGAGAARLAVRVIGPDGSPKLDAAVSVPELDSEASVWLAVAFVSDAPGLHHVRVVADDDDELAESDEINNTAERTFVVVGGVGLAAQVRSDRERYAAFASAALEVLVANSGTPFVGVARTTVEDLAGGEVALLDDRPLSLGYGDSVALALAWNTGTTRAGRYAFRVRVYATDQTTASASAERAFDIEPGLTLVARVRPQPASVTQGAPAGFALSVDNRSANTALAGASARLRVQLEGTSGPATFETVRALPSLPPAGSWEALDVWPAAQPAGRYGVRFEIEKDGSLVASASAILTIGAAGADVSGALAVIPAAVLAGEAAEARLTLVNRGIAAIAGYPIAVEVVAGPEASVRHSIPASVDLAAGESRPITLAIATGTLPPGPYSVRLRGGPLPITLDRASLVVHGPIAPPSPHAPTGGARVGTRQPSLEVNNAASAGAAPLTYEFELFGDEALTQALPGARSVPETPSRTAWTVVAGLAEDTRYWWRARAGDGFSQSAWSDVATFMVDAVNRPPSSPVPDSPAPDARVASRQPALSVRNAVDPERQPMTYEFRLGTDESLSQVVAVEAGIAEGLGFTGWTVPTTLDEDALYYWSARARTAGDTPEDVSPWSVAVAFRVDSFNGSPSAPRPLRPIGGTPVASRTPELVVDNANDPEGDALGYRFEIDTRPELDSPERQLSPELTAGPAETGWTPALELLENTHYYWRAHASDGNTVTPSELARFFVNVANDAPGAPLPLDPVDGRSVASATPTLRLRNAVDPDSDALSYEVEVRGADGSVVAATAGIPAGVLETTWIVAPALAEDQAFTWSARASDGELFGPWSVPAAFSVNAVIEPPTAPVPLLPADGSQIGERRPTLVVDNATSPDGLALTYTFELEAVATGGSVTPVERAEGVPEGSPTTAWTASLDLADGSYQWRARASDPLQDGPWSPSSRFSVHADPPPAPPTGLRALAADARVHLDWTPNPEPDVDGYRVYRGTASGGPYGFVAAVTAASHLDAGLVNGVTYYYVVTATNPRAESEPSSEAAARPEAPQALLAEVRYDPSVIRGECLLREEHHHRHDDDDHDDDEDGHDDDRRRKSSRDRGREHGGGHGWCSQQCPTWLLATIELPAGRDPATIELASLRLLGSVPAEPGYRAIVDVDRDGIPELRVRFRFEHVARKLAVGQNTATIVGRAAGIELMGSARIEVLPLAADLRITPRTLQRRARGQEVLARISFAQGVRAAHVAIGSVRLNGTVCVARVLEREDNELVVKFDRSAVVGVLPLGAAVEVRVAGTLAGLPFSAVDHIRVIQ